MAEEQSQPAPVVSHEPEARRFVFPAEPEPAVLEYHRAGAVLTINRTFVPASLRGQGIAAILTEAALAYARAEGLRVVPACSYVDVYLQRHTEWADLRA